jgi:hypothetical protein
MAIRKNVSVSGAAKKLASNTPPKKNAAGHIVTGRKKHVRGIRSESRTTSDGARESHRMEYGEYGSGRKKRYVANPTLFQEKDKSWSDKSGKGNEAFREASKRGEVYSFKSKKRAEKFSYGSWKKGEDRKQAMKAYREDMKSSRQNKKGK